MVRGGVVCTFCGLLEICVVEDEEGAVAAEF